MDDEPSGRYTRGERAAAGIALVMLSLLALMAADMLANGALLDLLGGTDDGD